MISFSLGRRVIPGSVVSSELSGPWPVIGPQEMTFFPVFVDGGFLKFAPKLNFVLRSCRWRDAVQFEAVLPEKLTNHR